jgi:hypothetical protein
MTTLLERAMPVYHFNERHSRWVEAEPDDVWTALTQLRLSDLTVTRPLVMLRGLSRPGSPEQRPLLERGPVRMFDAVPPNYAIGGLVARPWQLRPARVPVTGLAEFADFDEPGWVKCLTDFQVQVHAGRVRLSTETRGYSTDRRARQRFALYWALIRPGSGLIRRDVLAAVARKAEQSAARRAEQAGRAGR